MLCTRIICFEKTCGNILDELDQILLSEFLYDLSVDQEKNAYEAFNYRHISFNCSFRKSKINLFNDWYRKSNFHDVFYFGANHPLLVQNPIMAIAIRVFLNLTYHKVMKECDGTVLRKSSAKLFVSMN